MPSFYATLDRFEDNDQAVLELDAGVSLNVPHTWLPPNAQEGDVLKLRVGEGVSGNSSYLSFLIDMDKTAELREAAKNLRALLPEGPEGDLEL